MTLNGCKQTSADFVYSRNFLTSILERIFGTDAGILATEEIENEVTKKGRETFARN